MELIRILFASARFSTRPLLRLVGRDENTGGVQDICDVGAIGDAQRAFCGKSLISIV
jgi:hypothetical protein